MRGCLRLVLRHPAAARCHRLLADALRPASEAGVVAVVEAPLLRLHPQLRVAPVVAPQGSGDAVAGHRGKSIIYRRLSPTTYLK